MSRPQNLSSSVSMFIEDSRVAAVANANVNPVNPAHFYTISAFSHSPNIREASVSHDKDYNTNASNVSYPDSGSPGLVPQFPTRPSRLEIRNCHQQSRSQDLNLNFSENSKSPSVGRNIISGTSIGIGEIGGNPHNNINNNNNNNRRPREIIHKIRREADEDDDEEDTKIKCDNNFSSTKIQSQNPNSDSFEIPIINLGSDTNNTTFCANTVVVGVGCGGNSRRVSLSVQPRMPWNNNFNSSSNNNVIPENSTGSSTASTSFILTSVNCKSNSNPSGSSIKTNNNGSNSAKCVHVINPIKSQQQQREDRDRSFTSVNLTLKSPTSGGGCGSVAGSITQQVLDSDSNCEYSCSTAISSPLDTSGCLNTTASASVSATASASSSSNNIRRIPGSCSGSGPGTSPGVRCKSKNSVMSSNNGSSLTYSSYSNFRDGFESQLQIQIGPHGGTISASRRRNSGHLPSSNNLTNVNCPSHNKFPVSNLINSDYINSMQQMNEDLVAAQRERKQKLETSLSSERIRLSILRGEIASLRSKFQKIPDLERLKNKNQHLRLECDLMTRQVDLYDNGTVPLGETSEEFYREINPGQDAKSLISSTSAEANLGTTNAGGWPRGSGRGKPPPRPPPPRILHFNPHPPQHHTHHSTINPKNNENDNQSGEWCCFMCTFRNHPDLEQCEQCQMVRVRPSNSPASGAAPPPYYHR